MSLDECSPLFVTYARDVGEVMLGDWQPPTRCLFKHVCSNRTIPFTCSWPRFDLIPRFISQEFLAECHFRHGFGDVGVTPSLSRFSRRHWVRYAVTSLPLNWKWPCERSEVILSAEYRWMKWNTCGTAPYNWRRSEIFVFIGVGF